MPRLPRKFLFDESEPGIYHCINRCVRRAFLCGADPVTGECFEHRKVALQERLAFLAGQLGIDPTCKAAPAATDIADESLQIAAAECSEAETANATTVPGGAVSRDAWLSPFELMEAPSSDPIPAARSSNLGCLPMSFAEYLQLLDWTGRQYRPDKRGAIPSELAPILERVSLDGAAWLKLMRDFRSKFSRAAGRPESLTKEAQKRGGSRMPGINHSREIFGTESAPLRQSSA